MARGRKRRPTTTQRIASVATIGMPQPVRAAFATRLGSFFLVFLIPLLLLTGILTIEWKDGRPQFRFHRERAQEIRQEIREEASDVVQRYRDEGRLQPAPRVSDPFGGSADQDPTQPRPMARVRDTFDATR